MREEKTRKPLKSYFRALNDRYYRAFRLLYPSVPVMLSLCFLAVGIFTGSATKAQSDCFQVNCTADCDNDHGGPGSCPDATATDASTFPQNAAITLNIDPAWRNVNGVDMTSCIVAAFTNWQNATNGISGVRFSTITYNSGATASGQNAIQVNAPTTLSGDQTAAQVTWNMNSAGTHYANATISVDSRATNCTAITQTMAHEIGHLMGLQDCDECCAGTTVMAPPRCSDATCSAADFNDTTFGRTGPGGCDVATMNTHYNPATHNPPQPNPPATSGSSGSFNRGDWAGTTCYQWVQVTVYYVCGASGCTFVGVTYSSYGTFCF